MSVFTLPLFTEITATKEELEVRQLQCTQSRSFLEVQNAATLRKERELEERLASYNDRLQEDCERTSRAIATALDMRAQITALTNELTDVRAVLEETHVAWDSRVLRQ